MHDMDDVVREFLVESHEGLDRLDQDFVALEQRPGDRALLGAIFRCIHTIKGTCGFLGFAKLEEVAHAGETLLAPLRDGTLALTPAMTTALLRLVDAIRAILAAIEASGAEGDGDYAALAGELLALAEGGPAAAPAPGAGPEPATGAVAAAGPVVPAAAPAPAAEVGVVERRQGGRRESDRAAEGHAVADTTIRVDVGLLDRLMNLVGELVLARNQILQVAAAREDGVLVAATQRLHHITTELQEGVMKTRMQPIGHVWNRFPRVVRDLGLACGKQVRLEMEGEETELDKSLLEAIKDPLTHIVRNSVDHGFEAPEVRVAAGKPPHGTLRLRAWHEGGQVNIEIRDDGGGIHPERVKAKALEKGLVTAEQAARLGERELQQLIFLPGFSTAERVSNISGRGVGMDVVKTNIERIGGTVDVQSTVGAGTVLRLTIPLTLAIVPALLVSARGERFAIPQASLVELVRAEAGGGARGIERLHGAPVFRLRGRLLPLVVLADELGLGPAPDGREATSIVVLHADGRQFGLVVDAISDSQEIVVKPLGAHLKGLPVFAGATIMGDGAVALILDVPGLAQRARVLGDRAAEALPARAAGAGAARDRHTLLVVRVGARGRVAIPLADVQRLEEIPRDRVEWAGNREVAQYRGGILPLVRLSAALGVPAADDPARPLPVVVYRHGDRPVGLVVDTIVDIVEEAVQLERPVEQPDLVGSAIIQQRVTDLLDIEAIVRAACPWLPAAPARLPAEVAA